MKKKPDQFVQLREKALKLLEQKSPEQGIDIDAGNILGAIEEIRLYQIELEVQNEELENTQKNLEESRLRYLTLYEEAPIGYLTVNALSNILDMNKEAARLLNVGQKDALRKPLLSLVDKASKVTLFKQLNDVLNNGAEGNCEVEVLSEVDDGPKRILQMELKSQFDRKYNNTICFIALVDISLQKQAQKRLDHQVKVRTQAYKKSEKLLSTIFQSLHDLVIVLSPDMKLVTTNYKGERPISYAPTKEVECYRSLLFDEKPCDYCKAEQVFKTGQSITYEQKTPSEQYQEVQVIPVFDETGRVELVVEHIRDITERKAQEHELAQHRDHLERLVAQRTKDMQESRDFLEAVIENLPIGLQIFDEQGYSLRMNQAMADLVGIPSTQYGVGEFNVLNDPFVSSNKLSDIFRAAYAGQVVFDKEFIIQYGHEDDHWTEQQRIQYLRYTVFPLFDDNKAVKQVVSLLQDVTERTNAEMLIYAREEQFRLLTEHTFDLISEIDPQGRYVYVNKRFEDVLGYEADVLIGQDAMSLFHPDDRQERLHKLDHLLKEGGSSLAKFRYRHRKGYYLWFEGGVVVYRDSAEKLRIMTSSRDITRRLAAERKIQNQYEKIHAQNNELLAYNEELQTANEELQTINETMEQTNEELRHSRQTLKTVLDNIQAIVYVTDMNDNILYINQHTRNVFGDIEGKKCWDALQEGQSGICTFCSRYQRGGNDKDISKSIIEWEYRNTKNKRWYYCIDTLIDWIDNRKVRMQIATDISKQKDAELQLLNAYEKERELKELKSGFVSMASHQFRTPLTTIQSSLELLEIYAESAPTNFQTPFKKHANRIIEEIERLQELMEDILMLGNIESGKLPFEPIHTDLVEFCRSVISQQSFAYQGQRSVQFITEGHPQVIDVDHKLLGHALTNLISNAFKYSDSDPQLKLIFNEDHLQITVGDEGIGIPEDAQKHLFQGFYRAQNAKNVKGTGLGLLIAKQFVELHDGTISFQSRLNQGTEFFIILPYGRSE